MGWFSLRETARIAYHIEEGWHRHRERLDRSDFKVLEKNVALPTAGRGVADVQEFISVMPVVVGQPPDRKVKIRYDFVELDFDTQFCAKIV